MIEFDMESLAQNAIAKVKVLGIGGGGSNMVNDLEQIANVDRYVANTDAQALKNSSVSQKIQLGLKSTRGFGAGANPDIGRRAAEESLDKVVESLKDADVVFLICGLGGGTGSGAMPVIARALKEKDILTIAIVTKPFIFEGKRREKIATDALELIKKEVDTLIVLPNQKLVDVADEQVSLVNAFGMINDVVKQFVKSIAEIISASGQINVDFADIKTIMKQKGFAVIGTGRATGSNRAYDASLAAINSPLLDNISIQGAQGVLLNICGSSNLGLHEVSSAVTVVQEQAHENASIILGSVIDETLGDEVVVTIIATGFDQPQAQVSQAPAFARALASIKPSVSTSPIEVHAEKPLEKSADSSLKLSAIEKATIDLNNIDVPAVMRRMAQEKQGTN